MMEELLRKDLSLIWNILQLAPVYRASLFFIEKVRVLTYYTPRTTVKLR
jgi:hypothetical protein